MLASPILKKMYSGAWKEATNRNEEGLFLWQIDAFFEPEAFTIVMNVIHGRNRKVPRHIELETLAKVAVVTDYLQCHEAMDMFSNTWICHLKDLLPDKYCRELVLWIMISSIFYEHDIFRSTTHTAILKSHEKIPAFDLPIHDSIIGKLSDFSSALIV